MILAIETATDICSVAFRDEEGNITEKRVAKRGSHSEKLFLFIEELMDEYHFSISDLNAVLVSEGPGSYTGLRISASAVKGLLFQSNITLYSVNTLASFAAQAVDQFPKAHTIHSIVDARRVHVYYQKFIYENDMLKAQDKVEVTPIKKFESAVAKGDIIIGTGLKRIRGDVRENAMVLGQEFISAKSLISLLKKGFNNFYREVDPESFDPEYYTSNQV
ncbi:MAG: tRNA (adenosine(37)-N6)-threonylcarbamoyltransferase complex dimerization subunit type 1 TsaB [Balneolaceae bacterium]|jgi:tRNA threonylcarbamoyl adenosine modification protein YeaZ